MYPLHQAQEDLLALLRPLALDAADLLRAWDTGAPGALPMSQAAASLLLLECAGTTHRKPPFGLTQARVGDRLVGVREEAVLATPFCTLRRFAKDVADPGTRVLVVAPLSGHFATRFRGTLEALLPE
jgi:poly(3-hydroxybutyrate) depolymerase